MTDAPKTQAEKILWLLQSAWPNWVPSPELAKISLQYGSRIFGLRKKGWAIANRIEMVGGSRHGFFRLGSRPMPSSKELREKRAASFKPGISPEAKSPPAQGESLFGDLSPDRTYQE
jgi:hypothetical protein